MRTSTLQLVRAQNPRDDILSLFVIVAQNNYVDRVFNERHFRRPLDVDPLKADLDQMDEGIIGYICKPSTEREAIQFS